MGKGILNTAIIGAGKAARNLADAISVCPGVRTVRIMSATRESSERMAADYGVIRFGNDYREVLDDRNVQAVIIASPDKFHCEQAVLAAEAGKHILCEKPMCNSTEEAEQMIQAAERAGVTLMIGFCERFTQPCIEAKERIVRGEIGEPVMILARRCHPKYIVRGRGWLNDNETGGVLNYAGTHNIDLICWLLDAAPERVYSEMGQLVLENQNFTDCAVMTFRFPDNKIAALYESFAYPDPYPHGVDRSIEVLGKKGSLKIDFMHQPLTIHSEKGFSIADSVTWPRINNQLSGALINEVNHFIASVSENKPVLTSGKAGLLAIRIANAANQAAQSGRAVYLD
jgi:UDP-N-acetylglucosamine 3-dehydrogenase